MGPDGVGFTTGAGAADPEFDGMATGAVWASTGLDKPAAITSATMLERAPRRAEALGIIWVIRETIGGWRRLTRRARRGI